jgi:hypothetical protein
MDAMICSIWLMIFTSFKMRAAMARSPSDAASDKPFMIRAGFLHKARLSFLRLIGKGYRVWVKGAMP